MAVKKLQEHIEETHDALRLLEARVNEKQEVLERLHRSNLFNRRFSAVLSSYSDYETIGLRLARNIIESQIIGCEIQLEMKELKKTSKETHAKALRLINENKADFKSLYIFAKIFLDEYTTLLGFIHNWRGISNGSITSFYSALSTYKGEDEQIKKFIDSCLNRLKAVDVFITQYRDKFIVHDQTEHKETRWFLSDRRGGVRFLGGRPSITPQELAFVVAGYIVDTSKFTIEYI